MKSVPDLGLTEEERISNEEFFYSLTLKFVDYEGKKEKIFVIKILNFTKLATFILKWRLLYGNYSFYKLKKGL